MLRMFRSHSFYVALATLVLSGAVGINLLVFTIVNALWLRPLPFPSAERVAVVLNSTSRDLTEPRLEVFEGGVAGQVLTAGRHVALQPKVSLVESGMDLETLAVTPRYFSLLGLAVTGRDFSDTDDQLSSELVGIISHRFWADTLGRRPDAIGLLVPARPTSFRIIGIAPSGFVGAQRGERADLWIPSTSVGRMALTESSSGQPPLMVFGKLGPEQSVEMIDQRLRALLEPQQREWFLKYDPGWASRPLVAPISEVFGSPSSRTIVVSEGSAIKVVVGLAIIVLLGGCATIAALVLVHYERRRGEFALKACLGATRSRLVVDLVRDVLMLTALGTAGGLIVAVGGLRILPALSLPGGVEIARLNLSIDWQVAAFGVFATAVTLGIATALPIARSTRPRLVGEWSTGATASASSERVRQLLLATQVCATVTVLVAAGLFIRAVNRGFDAGAGFDVDRTVFVTARPSSQSNTSVVSVSDMQARALERNTRLEEAISALPAVEKIAFGSAPIGPEAQVSMPLVVKVGLEEHELLVGQLRGDFRLLGALSVRLLAGRELTRSDAGQSPVPTVITDSLAKQLWPDGSPLGQTFVLPQMRMGLQVVVGITADIAYGSLNSPHAGVLTTVSQMVDASSSALVIRTERPDEVAVAIRRGLGVSGLTMQVQTGRESVSADLGRQRLGAWFFSGFGLVALAIGLGGAFGLVAYLAESRKREFAVRMALGASSSQLVRRGMSAALFPVTIGILTGLLSAAGMSKVFTAVLVGVDSVDTVTYVLVALATASSATLAALVAAWRLKGVQPSAAMKLS